MRSSRTLLSAEPDIERWRRLPPDRSVGGAHGFTLIEMLLAMAILSMLVTALFTFIFSMGEIWGRGGEKRLFVQHVNAVTRHVDSLLRRAAWPHGGVLQAEPFTVREVRQSTGSTANLLGFDMLDGDRLMRWPEQALPDVECSLGLENDKGLMLYWRSHLEKYDKNDPPRAVLISPLVTKLTYAYHDENGDFWRKEETLQRGQTGEWMLPDRLILAFKQDKFEEQRELTLPAGGGGTAF